MKPIVSVLVPSYNYGSKIGHCIRSVLDQDHPSFELVISDDASTDDSDAVIRSFDDHRIRYKRQPKNLGMVPNWRSCVEQSRGEYLLLLGADDYLRPGMLRQCAAVLDADEGIAFCHTAAEFFREDGRVISTTGSFQRSYVREGSELIESFIKGRRVVSSSSVFRRRCWEELGGWSAEYRNCMDLDLWFRMLLRWRVGYIGSILTGFSAHEVSTSWQIMQSQEDLRFLEAMFERLPPTHAHLSRLKPELRQRLCRAWLSALVSLPQSEAREDAIKALGGPLPAHSASEPFATKLRVQVGRQTNVWLSKLPASVRYKLGDYFRLAG